MPVTAQMTMSITEIAISGLMSPEPARLARRRGGDDGEVGEQRRELGARAGAVGAAEALLELVVVEPAVGGVGAQRLRRALALRVRGQEVWRVRHGHEGSEYSPIRQVPWRVLQLRH